MTNLDSIFKSRDITLPTKIHLVKTMVFPVVMYGCESWTVKKAERRRIDAFEVWCWRSLLMKVKVESEKVGLKHSENEDHGIWSHQFMGNKWGNSGNSVRLDFLGAPKSLQMVTAAMKLKDAYSLERKL